MITPSQNEDIIGIQNLPIANLTLNIARNSSHNFSEILLLQGVREKKKPQRVSVKKTPLEVIFCLSWL